MSNYKDNAQSLVERWFNKAEDWQKDLFVAIWNGTDDIKQNSSRAIKLIAQEYFGENHNIAASTSFPSNIMLTKSAESYIMINSIGNVSGVGAIAANKELSFEDGLTVVYGENGCGKTSYVRILKALENPKCSDAILGNVFEKNPEKASATIVFSLNGEQKIVNWNKNIGREYPIQIYDNDVANRFVDKEREVIYEPKLLSVITIMAAVYSELYDQYSTTIDAVEHQQTSAPDGVDDHYVIKEFNELSSLQNFEKFETKYVWAEGQELELKAIISSLEVSDPDKCAVEKAAQKAIIDKHKQSILEMIQLVSDQQCKAFIAKREKQIRTKETADELTTKSQGQSLLKFFGTDEWKRMWLSAVEYIKHMEKEATMPLFQENRCALCQQELNVEAQARMSAFKDYFESKAISESECAYNDFASNVKLLQDNIENKVDAKGLEIDLCAAGIDKEYRNTIISIYKEISKRCEWLLEYNENEESNAPALKTKEEITAIFDSIFDTIDGDITALKNTARDRETQLNRMYELKAIKWATENIATKKRIIRLRSVVSKCKTNALTTLKKDLSKLLITDAYIERFDSEMKALDEKSRIKVELVASSPKKGKAYHQISLKNVQSSVKHKNGDILSEGEFRVVSLSAFLADLSSCNQIMPFIFDDPITSLDHKFEERVAKRLVRLSTERQVIVFTHRLAFAQLLEEATKNYNVQKILEEGTARAQIKHIELLNNPLGEPTSPSYTKQMKFEKSINQLLNHDLAQVKRLKANGDYGLANTCLRAVCDEFRVIVENGIESELLNGVVSRFSRNIRSLKLPYLLAIKQEDINLFDEMMTKYSYQLHSSPIETPCSIPSIEEVENDLNRMIEWSKEYNKRCKEANEKHSGKG